MNSFQTIILGFTTFLALFFIFIYFEDKWHKSRHNNDRVRCPPKNLQKQNNKNDSKKVKRLVDISVPDKNITLYDDKQFIDNKGFVNELMYKPEIKSTYIHDETIMIPNNIPLNETCKEEGDLPIANINVEYLLKKSTTKLEK